MLTVIAKVKANPSSIEKVSNELQKLVEPTRNEKGCVDYSLYQDNDEPTIFMFYENWESREDLDNHMISLHFKTCFEMIDEEVTIEANHLSMINKSDY